MTKLRVTFLAVALVVACAACGVDSPSMRVDAAAAPPLAKVVDAKAVLAAVDAADAITSGTFSVTAAIGPADDRLTVGAKGSFDVASRSGQVKLDPGSSGIPAVSAVVVDGIAYVQLGDLGQALGVKTPWVSLDYADLAKEHGLGTGTTLPSAATDPQSVLDVLKGVSGPVTTVGPESVGGDPATHLRLDVIPAKAIAKLPADRQAKLRELLGAELDTPLPLDLWIDGPGHIRKASLTRDLGAELGSLSVTFQIDSIDVPVYVTAPPAGQVTRAEDLSLLKGLLGPH